jgi:protein-tyrosine phosphatase
LDDDIAALARQGIGVLVSLLRQDEQDELALQEESASCVRHRIAFVPLPVPDLGVPPDAASFIRAVHELVVLLRGGAGVAIHCRQSVGRSGLLAVSMLVACGSQLETAIETVSVTRGVRVPETEAQREWLRVHAGRLAALKGAGGQRRRETK